jgi:hypothetical protein
VPDKTLAVRDDEVTIASRGPSRHTSRSPTAPSPATGQEWVDGLAEESHGSRSKTSELDAALVAAQSGEARLAAYGSSLQSR